MPISRVHSFLVHPSKNEEEQPEISGASIPRRGRLYEMLAAVFERAPEECDIEVVFRPTADGRQQNDCRDLLLAYAAEPSIPHGRAIAARLQMVSTHRSGLGLLFLMKGETDGNHQLVISRFPADQGIVAQEHAQLLAVEFIERVFMKNAKTYKSAFYSSDSLDRGFWDGLAIDRQSSSARELSDYWIREFLLSELRTTAAAGTKRLAIALRDAVRLTDNLGVRQELIAAASLMRGQHGQRRNTRQIIERLGLSAPATQALESAFPRRDLMNEVFQFDREEFQRHAPYRAIELDNGGVMIAEDARFNQVFREEVIPQAEGRVRFVTEGRVVGGSLRKTK